MMLIASGEGRQLMLIAKSQLCTLRYETKLTRAGFNVN
uniref:Uncharacterized protein n=1 Tax=Anguilla anguilla TaxID=7936 RepID=A0A0E9W1Y3_ANGAN